MSDHLKKAGMALGRAVRAATDDGPALVTIPNVEIVSTGTYHLASGETTFTEDDLRAAVEATNDPSIRNPRLKLGHTSLWGDAEPAFGKVENLRLGNNNQTIFGDYVGVPAWLAEIMPSAYPARSMEGYFGVESATGRHHDLVITAVSLLGVVLPGVATLEDLSAQYGATVPEGLEVYAGTKVEAQVGGEMKIPGLKKKDKEDEVNASVAVEDVRRTYYEEELNADQAWWWIREIRLDPQDLIVDDEEGSLYRVPWSIEGESITFGEPVEVQIVYVDADNSSAAVAAAGGGRVVASFSSRDESRPENNNKEDDMELNELRSLLGLADDASEDDVRQALQDRQTETTPPGAPAAEVPETGTPVEEQPANVAEEEREPVAAGNGNEQVTVDRATLTELQQKAGLGVQAHETLVANEDNEILDKAIKAGKFPKSRREAYAKMLKADREGAKQTIASLEPGLVPVEEKGGAPDSEIEAGAGYPQSWFPEVAARQGQNDPVQKEVA